MSPLLRAAERVREASVALVRCEVCHAEPGTFCTTNRGRARRAHNRRALDLVELLGGRR